MSVVAAKIYENKISIAADSIICQGDSKRTNNFAKLYKDNDLVIGAVGSAEEASLMRLYMHTHKPAAATIYDVLTFISEFSTWKSTYGDRAIENEYLLIYNHMLFHINGLFVHQITDYWAIGAGQDFASACLYLGHSPHDAVKTACELSCWVSEPIIEYEAYND